jgi:hypothetical protein
MIGKGTWIAPAIYEQMVALSQEILQAREKRTQL